MPACGKIYRDILNEGECIQQDCWQKTKSGLSAPTWEDQSDSAFANRENLDKESRPFRNSASFDAGLRFGQGLGKGVRSELRFGRDLPF